MDCAYNLSIRAAITIIAAIVETPVPPIPAIIIFLMSLIFSFGFCKLFIFRGKDGNVFLIISKDLLDVTPIKLGQKPLLQE